MSLEQDRLGPVTTHDLLSAILETEVGRGMNRIVYTSKLFPGTVIKVASTRNLKNAISDNMAELAIWESIEMMPERVKKWFCPCISIGCHGTILFMKYAEICSNASQLPTRVPSFFTDLKVENWGILNGTPVCVDYAKTLVHNVFLNKATRAADWWSSSL